MTWVVIAGAIFAAGIGVFAAVILADIDDGWL